MPQRSAGMVDSGVRDRCRRRETDRGVSGRGQARAGDGADWQPSGRGAIFRRERRNATGDSLPVWSGHQSGLGHGAPQTDLPHIRLRIAGIRHRRRFELLPGAESLVSTHGCVYFSILPHCGRRTLAGGSPGARIRYAMAVECLSVSGPAPSCRRPQGAGSLAEDALGGPAGGSVSGPGTMPGQRPRRRNRTAGSPAGIRDRSRLSHRGDGLAGPGAGSGNHRKGRD